ncbi:hypothetical protein F2Q70_00016832 [Brassica cretica]|uniref:Uncharacterized protein n=1 Tax=Brassica cretica TaxID=69181 RepID=A0A8S9I3P1_BRACR|nr:hypothetical protein F2Q70_00016832 [Brassica cretica]
MSKKKEVSAEIQLQEVIANIDLLNEVKDGGLTVDAELARLKEMEEDCEGLVASAAMSDWSISELDLRFRISLTDKHDFRKIFASLAFEILLLRSLRYGDSLEDMASRRTTVRDSERIQTRAGSVNMEHIRSRDVGEAFIEVLREETRLPRASTQEGKDLEGEKSAVRVKSSSPTGSEGRDCPPKKAKMNGSDHRLGVSGEMAVAKPFHW